MSELRKLPISGIDKEKQQTIISIVDKILDLKEINNNSDTSVSESEIDQLVYQLYELTDEGIKIIEGK